MATQDEICSGTVESPLLRLQLADPTARLVPMWPIELLVDYSKVDALGGITVPLELLVTGPTTLRRFEYVRFAPRSVVFTPTEEGVHVALLRQMAHDLWTGSLRVTVEGRSR